MMAIDVTDTRSNLHDQIANAANILGRSKDRKKVFKAIYEGKQRVKTKKQIARRTKLSEIRVLQEGRKLVANRIVDPDKVNGTMAYKKIPFFSDHKTKILRLAENRKKLSEYATKVNPVSRLVLPNAKVKFPYKPFTVSFLAVDDIKDFSRVRKARKVRTYKPLDEAKFKEGIKKIIGEAGKFSDWGGEKNDLFTTRVRINSKRVVAVFAFKGKGKKGILKPYMMGRNGDQILRLFDSDADLFVLQYWAQIDQSIYELMNSLAIRNSAKCRKKIYYCVIDGSDTARILKAYRSYFK